MASLATQSCQKLNCCQDAPLPLLTVYFSQSLTVCECNLNAFTHAWWLRRSIALGPGCACYLVQPKGKALQRKQCDITGTNVFSEAETVQMQYSPTDTSTGAKKVHALLSQSSL